jgi:hypothetical protein
LCVSYLVLGQRSWLQPAARLEDIVTAKPEVIFTARVVV